MSSVLSERVKRAREFLEKGEEFRILTHYDVDGICSAGIIANYLLKKDKRFHISFFRNVDKKEILSIAEGEDFVIMSDLGSSLLNSLDGNILILDHHKPQGDNERIIHINPHLDGYNGSHDACASTLAYMLAEDVSMAKFFLAGVFGDKQHLGGFTGLNKEIFEKLSINLTNDIVLYGNVMDAILYSTEPFFPGFSGRQESIEKLLRKLGISTTKKVEELNEKEKTKLISSLSLNLIKNSKVASAGRFIVDLDIKLDMSVRYITELIDSSARTDNQGIALSYILGEKGTKEKMELLRKDYKSQVIEGIYEMLENLFEMSHIQYFFVKNSYLASSIATIGALYLLDENKITIGMYVDNMVHISARSTKKLTDKVHLGDILRKTAQKHGGDGGGHDIAAGATIPKGSEERFLQDVNKEIEKSLFS